MSSIFASTRNTRTLLPDDYRFLRSDVPAALTPEEISWLVNRNILTVVDLRTEQERNARPCCLETDNRFIYHSLPVTGGSRVPSRPDAVVESYIQMVDQNMDRILETILKAPTGVLFFCNAGKDRTGVVAALLLKRLGINREYIIQDYLESAENLREILMDFAKNNPQTDIRVITPERRYIESFLNYLELCV